MDNLLEDPSLPQEFVQKVEPLYWANKNALDALNNNIDRVLNQIGNALERAEERKKKTTVGVV
jgi:hypothetical protein